MCVVKCEAAWWQLMNRWSQASRTLFRRQITKMRTKCAWNTVCRWAGVITDMAMALGCVVARRDVSAVRAYVMSQLNSVIVCWSAEFAAWWPRTGAAQTATVGRLDRQNARNKKVVKPELLMWDATECSQISRHCGLSGEVRWHEGVRSVWGFEKVTGGTTTRDTDPPPNPTPRKEKL